MRLGDLPAFRYSARPRLVSEGDATGFSETNEVHPETPLAELFARDDAAVIVIEPNVVPNRFAEAILQEAEVFNSAEAYAFPARLRVSGGFTPQGLCVIPKAALKTAGDVPVKDMKPAFVVPSGIGVFNGNDTPEIAFETAFNLVRSPKLRLPPDTPRLALTASLGLDALNGLWWVLGTFSGLAEGVHLEDAWHRHRRLLSAPDDIEHHLEAEARALRCGQRIPVRAISVAQSRVIRATLPDCPGPEYWRNFLEACQSRGEGFAQLSKKYRSAAAYLWDEWLA